MPHLVVPKIQRPHEGLMWTRATLDSDWINADVQDGWLHWWKDRLKSRGIKRLRKAVVGSERYTDWKVSDQYNLITVLNPLTSWQDSLYLASVSLIPSLSVFYSLCFTFLKRAATWSGIVFLYWGEKLRGETDAMSSGEIWSEASKDNFQFRRLGGVCATTPSSGNVNLSVSSLLSAQVVAWVHAYESLTSHPYELCKNKTLHELENCFFPLFTLHSKRLLYAKSLSLEHHL